MSDFLLQCGDYRLDLRTPQVMGIVNVTPDSFSDGGRFDRRDAAVAHAHRLVEAGAAIIDVGGESTRPGARAVSAQEELDRVLPVLEALKTQRLSVPISIDTSKPEVMRAAVGAGAALINDVRALQAPGALEMAVELRVPVCLMHMRGEPGTMQQTPRYDDVVTEVCAFLAARAEVCGREGIPPGRLLLDPGIGFGKTLEHNLSLLRALPRLAVLGHPVVIGVSRKRMFEQLLGRPVDQRLYGSLAAAVVAAQNGARLIRVHDVGPTVETLAVLRAIQGETQEASGNH